MANRDNSDNSDSASSVDLPAISGLNKNSAHPEEWTLPHEWSMEKRELFENWKMDVQNQIANLASSLEKSLAEYPNPDAGDYFNYEDEKLKAEFEKQHRLQARFSGGTLNYGLGRNPEKAFPDKYWPRKWLHHCLGSGMSVECNATRNFFAAGAAKDHTHCTKPCRVARLWSTSPSIDLFSLLSLTDSIIWYINCVRYLFLIFV